MPISLPANVLEFYLLGTRMTAATAKVRGYDIDQPEIRSAVLLTLAGADSDDLLKKAGLMAAGGKLSAVAFDRLPAPALMVLNKAIGFRLLGRIGRQHLRQARSRRARRRRPDRRRRRRLHARPHRPAGRQGVPARRDLRPLTGGDTVR